MIVLTTSDSRRDVLNAYEKSVNAYIRKPVNLDRFTEVIKAIDAFWLGVAALPSGPR